MPDIRPLTLSDRGLVSEYLRRHPPEISEHTFTNLFIWQPSRPILFAEIDNSLVFLVKAAQQKDRFILFGPPAGEITIPDVFAAFGASVIGAVRIPDRDVKNIPAPGLVVNPDRDNADYVYRVEDLAGLTGRRFAKKRNHIKQCLKKHACEYLPITRGLLAECETMQENWCNTRDCGRNPGLCNEANAIAETFAHFDSFGLIGGAIRVNGTVQAYAIAEELHPGTAVWHFEKAMADIPGLGQLINQWFAKHGLADFAYVNREQDLGIPGIRQAKKSYYPHAMVYKNCISLSADKPITAKSIKAEGCAAHEH
ncbi:MAG: phosphatidylglycerol lysyltransferase domain-containing protein [Desulfobulbales bacterium]|nr:phosphatidylglycerol lysyltransferase domain-containing protein [Desulfobulbales bacterium]